MAFSLLSRASLIKLVFRNGITRNRTGLGMFFRTVSECRTFNKVGRYLNPEIMKGHNWNNNNNGGPFVVLICKHGSR